MNDWKSKLQADPVPWLLEADNPSVRYLTLVDILARPPGSSEALKALAEITAAKRSTASKRTLAAGRFPQLERDYRLGGDNRRQAQGKGLATN